MAKNRIRKKVRTRPDRSSGPVSTDRSMDGMLSRVPNRDLLTAEEVRQIFAYSHIQSVYKMNNRGELTPYQTRNRGRAYLYKRSNVIAAIRARFELRPVSEDNVGTHSGEAKKVGSVGGSEGGRAGRKKAPPKKGR